VHTPTPEGTIGFPRVRTHCEYHEPLRFEDEIEVCLRVRAMTDKTITYDFLFRNLAKQPPADAASGSLKVVCVLIGDSHGDEPMRVVSIPDQVASKIEPAPPAR
jgi:acyl-CoA thioesterase FadM